jgi:CubicO group peptidase (beta-lactamase class C family)
MKSLIHLVASTGAGSIVILGLARGAVAGTPMAEVGATFDRLVRDQLIVGAQVIAGENQQILLEHYSGRLSPNRSEPVNANTLFCIGSDSKPMVAAIIMTMVGDGSLELDAPVSKWLPGFATLRLQDGTPARRAPTLRELLSHRSGIFSQKQAPTQQQLALIHTFTSTLADSVAGIAQQPLLAQPGEDYAYSGAGYCVLGRAAEVAGGRSIEELLHARLCRPLQLSRTTYFPINQGNVAMCGVHQGNGIVASSHAPHLLGQRLRFTLVGGSIYSTARDQARFARMVLGQGQLDGTQVLAPSVWAEWVKRQVRNPNYGLGWSEVFGNSADRPTRLSHEGELSGYRALIIVNLSKGFFCVANWTPVLPQTNDDVNRTIRTAIRAAEQAAAN